MMGKKYVYTSGAPRTAKNTLSRGSLCGQQGWRSGDLTSVVSYDYRRHRGNIHHRLKDLISDDDEWWSEEG